MGHEFIYLSNSKEKPSIQNLPSNAEKEIIQRGEMAVQIANENL